MIRNDVAKKLEYLKEELGLKSFSEVIMYLIETTSINTKTIISNEFEKLENFLTRYTKDMELLEVVRLYYIEIAETPSLEEVEEVRSLKKEAVESILALVRKVKELKKQETAESQYSPIL